MLNKQFCADGITLFRIPLFLLFVCKYLLFTFYPIVSEIVYMRNYFIHELELERQWSGQNVVLIFYRLFL